MNIVRLAYQNFKNSFRNYFVLIISMVFSVMILNNVLNLYYSDSIQILGAENADLCKMVLAAIAFVISVFLIFFIWYATRVFLKQRKKEIGIYAFMGLENRTIAKMYFLETLCIGIVSCVSGILLGVVSAKFFQTIIFRISNIANDIQFDVSGASILLTMIIFLFIYILMCIFGFISILRSNVLDMINANKQQEAKPIHPVWLCIKTVVSLLLLCAGYYTAMQIGEITSFIYIPITTLLVIVGVFGLFSSFFPFLFYQLLHNKKFLYRHERSLWLNSLSYRIQKNSRFYAIITILMITTMTVLGTAVAMNNSYEEQRLGRSVYTYEALGYEAISQDTVRESIEQLGEDTYHIQSEFLYLDGVVAKHSGGAVIAVAYSDFKHVLTEEGFAEAQDLPQLQEDETFYVNRKAFMSFAESEVGNQNTLFGKTYTNIEQYELFAYGDNLMKNFDFLVLSDTAYQNIRKQMPKEYPPIHYIGIKMADESTYKSGLTHLQETFAGTSYQFYSPLNRENDFEWIRVTFAIGCFLFMVFLCASASIIYLRVYNDAFEDRERYTTLQKIGIEQHTLKASICKEIGFCYILPLLISSITSYFSIHALASVLRTQLMMVNIISTGICCSLFIIMYMISVRSFEHNAGIR